MLDLPSGDVSYAKKKAVDKQVKRWVAVVTARFEYVPRKTLQEARHAISAMHGYSADFQDLAENVPIIYDKIGEEGTPWDL